MHYRGRFAPSPTGALHFGSLIAATASYLDARTHGGEWLLRIEDVDIDRCQPGATEEILRTLERFGFVWDGPVLRQALRNDTYELALTWLREQALAYPCACSRKEIAAQAARPAIDGGYVYPGTCRNGLQPNQVARAWRLRTHDQDICFVDRIQGPVSQNLEHDVGDFILRRADGLFAYQLAVVLDDHLQGITDIVRGADLLASTPRQIFLQQAFGFPTPRYAHLPVATNSTGEKWSKQTQAPALLRGNEAADLVRALAFLGQAVPASLSHGQVKDVWEWALTHWSLTAIPRILSINAPAVS